MAALNPVAQALSKTQSQNGARFHSVVLRGGLNLTASSLEIGDGECIQLNNYEVNPQGDYQSVTGFERFDGQPAPSATPPPNPPYETDEDELADLVIAREVRRDVITEVPGSGPVRGGFFFKDVCYAFRDTTDGTAKKLYKSTPTGWAEVTIGVTLAPGGFFFHRKVHFTNREREVIGVDGVNPAFVFDGTTYTEIATGLDSADEKPKALEILPSEIVILGYDEGSVQYSAPNDPFDWEVANGAGEFLVADDIQELDLQAQDTCAIFCRNRTYVLYGRVPSEFELTNLNTNTGAIRGTIQTIGDSVYLDDRGLTRLSRVEKFGNFDMSSMSQQVATLLDTYRGRTTASMVIREKNQYRLFFNDGRGLIVTFFGTEVLGYSTFDLGSSGRVAVCSWTSETEDGSEVNFIGGDDGFVYQMERGTNLDGDSIETVLRTAFTPFSQELINIVKRVTRVTLEAKVVNNVTLRFLPDYDYSDPEIPPHDLEEVQTIGGGGYWDEGIFNETYWSAASLFRADVYTRGRGSNVSVFVRTVSTVAAPHILTSVVYRYIVLDRRR